MRHDDEQEIKAMIEDGSLLPVGKGGRLIIDLIKTDLLEPHGLKPPADLPVYIAAPRLLPPGVSATTKFDSDLPPHEKQPKLIALNPDLMRFYPLDEIVGTIAHELIHASLPYDADPIEGEWAGHGAVFKEHARSIGLVGDPRSTTVGSTFTKWVRDKIIPALDKLDNHSTL